MWSFLLGLAAAQAPVDASLEEAYQREFAYLAAEKQALQRQLVSHAETTRGRLVAADAELTTLRDEYAALLVAADSAEDRLGGVERAADLALQGSDLLQTTLLQAHSSLGIDAIDVPEDLEARSALLTEAFTGARSALERGTTLRRTSETWFLGDGRETRGEAVHLGDIASWGVSSEGAGALIPVGEGRLQLYKEGAETARALIAGEMPAAIGLFVLEGRDKAIREAPEKTWQTKVDAGGPVGLVILGLGLVGMLLVVFRTLILAFTDVHTPVVDTLAAHRHHPRESLDEIAAEALLGASQRVERFGVAILVIAAIAPLLGLLGTVTGMISTFEIITEFGTGDPRMLSSGISEALVTTQLGLVVAIPTLLFGNLLSAWAERKLTGAERAALSWLNGSDPTPLHDNHGLAAK